MNAAKKRLKETQRFLWKAEITPDENQRRAAEARMNRDRELSIPEIQEIMLAAIKSSKEIRRIVSGGSKKSSGKHCRNARSGWRVCEPRGIY